MQGRRATRSHRASALVLAALAAGVSTRPAAAQTTGSLERFTPAPAGDALFGVPSPAVGGHLVPRATATFDFGLKPLSIQDQNGTRYAIVSRQAFLHIDASLALWDRLLVSVDMPFALLQAGDSPTVAGQTFPSPSGPAVGDLRLGARARLYGEYWDPFQIGLGGYVWVPTAKKASFAGDGAVRGEPQLLLGGRAPYFVWNVAVGATLRGSAHPHSFDAGAGAALVLGKDSFFQIGPELTVSAPFSKDASFSTPTAVIGAASPVSTELLLGAKLRPLSALVIGAGAGPGLTHGYGTPVLLAVASIGYEPLPPRNAERDRDGDGIVDRDDACPDVKGVHSDDPKKNGCPPDRDGDGIVDVDDACPDVPGVHSDDPKKNGCPADRDGDGIPDAEDACPDVKGIKSGDPRKNGCPPPPADRDDDGVPDAEDACPDVKGSPDPDPKKNGCPHVTVTKSEIVISSQIRFLYGRSKITQTVDPVSDALLTEVRDAIQAHPEMKHIEVQGHADPVGGDEFNNLLSQARADAVREWLIRRGIPAEKLTAKGYGSHVPIASNDTDEGRAQNRRVQFKIIE
jgi:outer membrane protein OmpA-like peptidoglycan-associated protein